MIQEIHKKDSLYFQLSILIIFSAIISVIIFFILNGVGDYAVTQYYSVSNYSKEQNNKYITKFQKYVYENSINMKSTSEINSWVKKQKIINIDLYQEDILIYSSEYPEIEIDAENIVAPDYEWNEYYTVLFNDGEATVSIYGIYEYKLYNCMFIIELIFCFFIFMTIFILGVRKKVNYIINLRDEIEILEGGNLDYNISVTGKDELAELAKGIDCMRQSFQEHVIRETEIVQQNQKSITEMSHDLRTPVTAIMLYITILKNEIKSGKNQSEKYLEKIEKKAEQIKLLTDNLFEYSLVSENKSIKLEKAENMKIVFYDLISETCNYLEHKGFKIQSGIKWTDKKIQINMDCITRIMDNIVSNIIKYADNTKPVKIYSIEEKNKIGFIFENKILINKEKDNSTGIGINCIKNLVINMGGICLTEIKDDIFCIEIIFPSL